MTFPDSHTEVLSFHLYKAPQHPLILCHPWLVIHNPHVNWATGEIINWGPQCDEMFRFLLPDSYPSSQVYCSRCSSSASTSAVGILLTCSIT